MFSYLCHSFEQVNEAGRLGSIAFCQTNVHLAMDVLVYNNTSCLDDDGGVL